MSIPTLNRKISCQLFIWTLLGSGCGSLPKVRHQDFSFPKKNVYVETPSGDDFNRPYQVLGWVRSKATFPTLEEEIPFETLCRNYYNKGADDLLRQAEKNGGDAVIQVRSVVFYLDGKAEEFARPECTDDGAQGEILMRGISIRWGKKDS